MNHGWLAALLLHAVALPDSNNALSPTMSEQEEREQHRYLALSLRNQKLLEQQAESKARQLAFQLQSAQALAAIRKLSVDQKELTTDGISNSLESYPVPHIDLHHFVVRSIFSWRDRWIARIEYAQRLYVVKDGDILFNRVQVNVDSDGVGLSLGEQRVYLRGQALW
ncbi:hypothetical protein FM042_00270 [Aliidiomarina halalkaliphila]|uniref:Uncharacterized protein n=1 Tax=Aliidiomarina halalkaliphila TaxID=2593535 RepID=A0A552X2U0_9GAMM|nr:hypothetical protein [Aliidiomarina halalkaliphila]TRW49347.1 hypothetical protein FM042_00270 [Aliidiomarina halalkaliphila]